jgi:transposase
LPPSSPMPNPRRSCPSSARGFGPIASYTDSFTAYDALDVSEFRHRCVNHSKTFVSTRGHPINGIENFWNQAKRHLRRFNGIRKESFYWYLKECEWRFNGGSHQRLLRQLKQWYRSSKH